MDLQNTFYLLAIIVMVLSALLIIGVIGLLSYLFYLARKTQKKINKTAEHVAQKVDTSADAITGLFVTGTIFHKIRKFLTKSS